MNASGKFLQGLTLVITRPVSNNRRLANMLIECGARVLLMPTIEIHPLPNASPTHSSRYYDILLFISQHAVKHGLPILQEKNFSPIETCKVGAVGQKTATCLNAAGWPPDILPRQHFNSEALLHATALQHVTGLRILIIRGRGGRELLGTTLQKRGAHVEYLEAYERCLPVKHYPEIQQLGKKGQIDGFITTSNEGLQNLAKICHHESWLLQTQLLVFSQRGSRLARELGFARPAIIATAASDQGILDSLKQWRTG